MGSPSRGCGKTPYSLGVHGVDCDFRAGTCKGTIDVVAGTLQILGNKGLQIGLPRHKTLLWRVFVKKNTILIHFEFYHVIGMGGVSHARRPCPKDEVVELNGRATCHNLPLLGAVKKFQTSTILHYLQRHPWRGVVPQGQAMSGGRRQCVVAAGGDEFHRKVLMLKGKAGWCGNLGEGLYLHRHAGEGRGGDARIGKGSRTRIPRYAYRTTGFGGRTNATIKGILTRIDDASRSCDSGVGRDGIHSTGILLAVRACTPRYISNAHRSRPILQIPLHVLIPQVAASKGKADSCQQERGKPFEDRLTLIGLIEPHAESPPLHSVNGRGGGIQELK